MYKSILQANINKSDIKEPLKVDVHHEYHDMSLIWVVFAYNMKANTGKSRRTRRLLFPFVSISERCIILIMKKYKHQNVRGLFKIPFRVFIIKFERDTFWILKRNNLLST